MKKISIVVPVYFNELNLPETIPELLKVKDKLQNYEFEIIFVDDGSKDKSLEILLDYQKKYSDIIRVVKLTRNFGSMAAIQAGLKVAKGDCVGAIAADLQDPPELLIEMVRRWEKGIKAVFATRKERNDPPAQKLFAKIFYGLIRRFALPDFPKDGFDFFLIDREIVNELNKISEKNTNLMHLIFWYGYDYVLLPYTRKARTKGKSKWTFNKKTKLFVDSFVGFSYVPIKVLPYIGILFALGSFIYGGYVFYNWAVGNIIVEGWTTVIIILTFALGIAMIMLGIIGEYLWRTLDESRQRPPYVIDKIF